MNELLADPYDRAPLTADVDVVRNSAGVWPVLGGLPFLVPDAARWIAGRRQAILAALAEAQRCTAKDLELVDLFAHMVRGVAPIEEREDWLEDEEPDLELLDGEAQAPLAALLTAEPLAARMAARIPSGPVLEIGPGAGTLTRRIEARPLVVVDRSPRAVLRAIAGTDAIGVVGEAEALPVLPEAFASVVAANVVDLVADPAALVAEVARSLVPGGRFVVSTPDPALGQRGPDEALVDLIEEAGLRVVEDVDGIPWLRVHGPRHVELYVVRMVVAER